MKVVLTQHYTDEHLEMYLLTSPFNKRYTDRKSYQYIFDNKKRCTDRNFWWEKIAWFMELLPTLEDGTLVVYQDCDSIMVGDQNLTDALHDNCEFGMVQMRGGFDCKETLNWYNAGVIFMINTPSVRDFLKRVWDRKDVNDEMSINKELSSKNYTIGNSKPICSLDVEWNCWDNNHHLCNDIAIKSWHGLSYEKKLPLIRKYISDNKLK